MKPAVVTGSARRIPCTKTAPRRANARGHGTREEASLMQAHRTPKQLRQSYPQHLQAGAKV